MKHDYNTIMSKKYRCPVCFTSKFVWESDQYEMSKTTVRTYKDGYAQDTMRIECYSCGFNFSVEI